MSHDREKLRHEIEELERQIASHPFEGLFDRKRLDQLQDRLKKKRKELAHLEVEGIETEHSPIDEHLDVPDLIAGIEETPDMGHDLPVNLNIDEEPIRKPSPGARPVVRKLAPAKKLAKPAKKSGAKPSKKQTKASKSKPKTTTAKKAGKKPAKKKSKR